MSRRTLCWILLGVLAATTSVVGQEGARGDGGLLPDSANSGRRGGWSAGAEVLFVAPRYESNPAYYFTERSVPLPGTPLRTSQRVEEFDYDYRFSPRLWLSYSLDCGIGARVRWFRFDQDANPLDVTNPAIPLGSPTAYRSIAGTSPLMAIGPQTNLPAVNSIQIQGQPGLDQPLHFTSDLYLDVWDFEAVFSDLAVNDWHFELTGGVRYARVEQSYAVAAGGVLSQVLASEQRFDGVGPVVGVAGHRPLGCTGLGVYGLGRASLLFGRDTHTSRGLNIGLIPDFTLAAHDDSSSRRRILPWIEFEMGLEGSRSLGPVDWMLRTGVVSQLFPAGSGPNGNGNLGLIGFTLSTGVRY